MAHTAKDLFALLHRSEHVPVLVCDRHPLSSIDSVQPQLAAAHEAWRALRLQGRPPAPDDGYLRCLRAVDLPLAVNVGFVGEGWSVDGADVEDPIGVRAMGHSVGPDVLLDLAREDARVVALTRTPSLTTIRYAAIRIDQLILPFSNAGGRTTTVVVMSVRASEDTAA